MTDFTNIDNSGQQLVYDNTAQFLK